MTLKMKCPNVECNTSLLVKEAQVGIRLTCPACGTVVRAIRRSKAQTTPDCSLENHIRVPVRAFPVEAVAPEPFNDFTLPPSERAFKYRRPHRGVMILSLGILSFFCAGLILGTLAFGMAINDLQEMNAGRMDRSGEGITWAGLVCGALGAIGAVLALIVIAAGVLQ